MRFKKLSGVQARKWRKHVSLSAAQRDRTMRTIKFPLELDEGIDRGRLFESAQALFKVTDGVGKGTLLGLLLSVHLSGFRTFSSGKETRLFRAFRNSGREGFKQSFREAFGCEPGKFAHGEIVNMLLTEPRKGLPFTRENLINRLYPLVAGKSLERDKKPNAGFAAFLGQFADAVLVICKGWNDVSSRIFEVMQVFDRISEPLGLPPIRERLRGLRELTPANSTIDLDPDLVWAPLLDDDPAALHKVVAQKLKQALAEGEEADAGFVKQEITSRQHNALSWLFGTGLRHWQQTDVSGLLADYGLSDDLRPRIEALREWFLAIPRDPLFASDEVNYNHTRKLLAGKVDSWVSNYLKRLREIEAAVSGLDEGFQPPEALDGPECSAALEGLGFSMSELREALAVLPEVRTRAASALERLTGRADELPEESDILAVEEFNEYLGDVSGMLSALSERLRRKHDDEGAISDALYAQVRFVIPEGFSGYAKLNRISGGPTDVAAELDQAVVRFNRLLHMMDAQAKGILNKVAAAGELQDPVSAREVVERARAGAHGRTLGDARDLAFRWVWQRIAGLGRTGSPALEAEVRACFERAELLSRKNLNKLLVNRQGVIYKSPFSTGRHQAYELTGRADPMSALEDLQRRIEALAAAGGSPEILGDLVRVLNLRHGLHLSGLPAVVRLDPAWRKSILDNLPVPAVLKGQLSQDQASRETVIKVFNLYQSELKGLQNMLFRKEFLLRVRFSRVGWDEFLYVPKREAWLPPEHVFASESPLGAALRFLAGDASEEDLDPVKALGKLQGSALASRNRGRSPFASYLRQAPHDWYVNLKLEGVAKTIEGIGVSKQDLGAYRKHSGSPYRLRGSSSLKGLFDEALVNPSQEIKEYTVQFERLFRQEAALQNGAVQVRAVPDRVEAYVSVPFEDAEKAEGEFPLAETVIGVDLGEIGIGYAVFSAKDFEKIESGTIRIKSIWNLMRNVQRFRGKTQPRQRFRQLASNQLALLRENVVGDVLHHIDGLCAKHNGVPILESSVKNLASGGRQLLLVYDKVVNAYAYPDIDAHKTARLHHWYGAHRWEHPFLEEVNQETGEVKKLNVFPGTVVHPAGTSQVCSKCGRNPYWDLQARYGRGGKRCVAIDAEGGVDVGTGRILLRQAFPVGIGEKEKKDLAKGFRRRNQVAPMEHAVGARTISPDEANSLIRSQLRRRSPSLRSRDTTQSVYHCPYEDCGHVMHADENAAVNIVRKWLRMKLGRTGMWRYDPPARNQGSAAGASAAKKGGRKGKKKR